MEELKEFKKELEEMLEKVNAKLEEDDKKYWLFHNGEVMQFTDDDHGLDIFNKEIGNYFKTREEAEEFLEDLKVKTEIKNIAKELNGGKKIYWNDNTNKYYLYYNYKIQCMDTSSSITWKRDGVTYCLDRNFMDVCVERIGEEILKNYLKRN